jgi:hypothetical protein
MKLDEFLRTDYWQSYQESIDNNLGINDAERYYRNQEAASSGSDGSTHGERLQDMREAVRDARMDLVVTDDEETALQAEIDEVEVWHIAHGSIDHSAG